MTATEFAAVALISGGISGLICGAVGFYAAAAAHERAQRREAQRPLAAAPPHVRIPNPPTPRALQFFDQDEEKTP